MFEIALTLGHFRFLSPYSTIMKRGNGYHDDGPPRKLLRNDDPSKLLRVLIPTRAAGPIIGKGGDTIKELRSQVGRL